MKGTVSIGDFSRMTHLSVKTLRHYHEIGLLTPAEIDAGTGYRYYAKSQVPAAQIIRRFRELAMPVEQVRALLGAPDLEARNRLIVAHLDRMQAQLAETQASLASLRALLDPPAAPIAVEERFVPASQALAIAATVPREELGAWWTGAFTELRGALRSLGLSASGPPGALFATDLFAEDRGEAVAFVQLSQAPPAIGRARPFVVPAAELAIAVHHGSHADVDRTYGALGTHVAGHALGVEAPVREYYLVDRFDTSDASQWRTEIGWPVFLTAPASGAQAR